MTTAGLLFSRLRNSAAVLTALAIVVFIATAALTSTLASVQQGSATGSRQVLDEASPRSAAVRITTHLADDAETQAAAALAMIDRLFPSGSVAVHSAQRSLPVDVPDSDGATAVFGVEPRLLENAEVTDGTWPGDGVAIQQDAAAALGLTVGDELVVGTDAQPVTVRVDALWRANDPGAPVWFAESTAGSGRDGDALGVFVVDTETLRELPTQLFASWTVSATHAALDDDNRDAVSLGLDRLHDATRATANVVDVSSSTEGSLAATLDRIADAGRGAAAIAASALVIVGLLAAVAIVQLCTVLVGSRRQQTDLARARGLSRPQLTAITALEALVIAVPTSTLGAAAAALLVSGATPTNLALIVAGVVVVTLGCLLAVVLFDVRPGARAASAARSPIAFVIGGSLVAAAAALATWQLYARGSVGGVNIVAATSPALALVAVAALCTALLYPMSGAIARWAERSAPVGTVLAARQVARRVARYLVPALALAIAVASAVFATGLATTWSTTERAVQFVGTGSDVSVALDTDGASAITAQPFAELADSDAATSLVLSIVGLGADRLPFVALRPQSVERVLGPEASAVAEALETTTPDDTGLTLDADATGITATVEITGNGRPAVSTFDVGIWAADGDGSLSRVPLVPGADGWSGAVPEGVGPWTLLAVETLRTGKPDPAANLVEVSDIAGDAAAVVSLNGGTASPRNIAGIAAADAASADAASPGADAPLPVAITTALADRVGLAIGDPLSFALESTGKNIDAVVSAITPRLPGVSSKLALGTDLAALNAVTLRPQSAPAEANEVWISTLNPAGIAAAVERTATSTAIVTTRASSSSEPVLASALTAFWLAAVVAALLALVAVGAFFIDDFRGRRGDIAVLRALGFSPRDQAAARSREQLIVIVFAVLVGAAGGAAATAITVGPFVASAVSESARFVSVVPAFDPLPWLGFCAALGALALAMCLALVATVRRSAAIAIDEDAA